MRKLLFILFFLIPSILFATDYYVATDGDDDNPGTIGEPFATWQKGFTTIVAGDVLYIRGGTYSPTSGNTGVYILSKNGTAVNRITVMAYADEVPILNCSELDGLTKKYGIYLRDCDYWTLKGLTVTGAEEISSSAVGIGLRQCNYCTLERCVAHHNDGPGFYIGYQGTQNYLYNCDSYYNYDPVDLPGNDPGGLADGFDCGVFGSVGDTLTIRSCRAWNNSDDGFDSYGNEGVVIYDSCWAIASGYDGGDGTGFKFGQTANLQVYPVRIMTNCIAVDNMTGGFVENDLAGFAYMYNNISYSNAGGFSFAGAYPNVAHIFRNNTSYANTSNNPTMLSNTVHDHNSWDIPITFSGVDFESVDTTGIRGARTALGYLPVLDFLKPSNVSQAIDAGVDVGIAYDGDAPDIGAYEFTDYETPPFAPAISTRYPYNVSSRVIYSGGYLIEDYGEDIIVKGICWGTDANPDLTDNVVSGGGGADDFTVKITGFSANTIYHIRAYATNATGTGYGGDIEFTTPEFSYLFNEGEVMYHEGKLIEGK